MINNESTANLQNFKHSYLELELNKILFAPDNNGVIQYEVFKDIPEYENHYQCSSFGRIKSLERYVERGNHKKYVRERILKQSFSRGYPSVGFKKDGKESKIQVHQLLAITFLNHKRCGFKVVTDHVDNVKTNNFIWNLQLISNRKNVTKNPRKGTSKFMGVSFNKRANKWRGLIYYNGKNIHLGFFDKEEDASQAYKNALVAIKESEPIHIKKKKNTSKYRGVYRSGNKWALGLKGIYHGTFDTEEQANNYKLKMEL